MSGTDLTRIENLVEDIYNAISRIEYRLTGSSGGPSSSSGTSGSGSGTPSGKDPFKEMANEVIRFRTGIRELDKQRDFFTRTNQNVREFGGLLEMCGGSIGEFGGVLTRYAGVIAGGIQLISTSIDLLKGINEYKNIKAGAVVKATERDIAEDRLQFQKDSQLNTLESQKYIEEINYTYDKALKKFQVESNLQLQQLKILADRQVKNTEIAVGSIVDGINEAAYRAAEYQIDYDKQQELFDHQEKAERGKLDLYNKLRDKTWEQQKEVFEKQEDVIKANYEAESVINARDKALEVRDAESEVAIKKTMLGVLTGAGVGTATGGIIGTEIGAAAGIETGPGAILTGAVGGLVGGLIGSAVGGATGLYKGINDETGKETYEISKDFTSDMKNVFSDSRRYNEASQNFRENPQILGKWENLMADWGLVDRTREEYFKEGISKFSSDLKMVAEGNKILTENAVNVEKTIWEKNLDLQQQSLDTQKQILDVQTEMSSNEAKNWLKLAQSNEKWLEKFDETTNKLGKSLGYTNQKQMDDYQRTMFTITKDVAAKFGKEVTDAVKFQQSFIETTGRNRIFDEHDYGQLFGLGEYLGDEGLASNYAASMEIFNTGVSDSVDMLDTVLQEVNKIGLNGRKYTKTLVDSLKLAQKYNFKGGTENLMKMAKWAENTRFNMSSLGSMLDKVSEGGLEGVIKMGAEFQVLGGHAAMNADPLAMMWERYNDPEAFARRMQDMTKGYGAVDKKTGETKFSGEEQMLMEQLARIQNRSYEDVANEVRARNKKEVVEKQLSDNFDEDQKAFISNSAIYDKTSGQFKVKVKQGDKYVDKNVNELTPEDLNSLIPEKHNERMEDYMVTVIDHLSKLTGITEKQRSQLGEDTFTAYQNNLRERGEISEERFNEKYYTEYLPKTLEFMNKATQAYQDFMTNVQATNDDMEDTIKKLTDAAEEVRNALSESAELIQRANDYIKDNREKAKTTLPDFEDSQAKFNAMATLKDFAYGTIGHDKDDLINIMSKIEEKYDSGNLDYNEYKSLLREGYNDLLDSLDAITGRGDSVNDYTMDDVRLLVEAYKEMRNNGSIEDGITSGNGSSMMVSASKVTPIHDGSARIAKTDPNDTALFAKNGGPFDTLFNNVFSRIDDVYETINSPLSLSNGNFSSNSSNNIKVETVKVEISGRLDLESNGRSINIIDELRTNPSLMRQLSEMLGKQISAELNGGKHNNTNNMGFGSFFL